jgi:UDP-N-acetyl-D-galactosamine dehydrogenase
MSANDPQPLPPLASCTVAVVGLGYVGLPLALAFARPARDARHGGWLSRRVIGFDINTKRLEELRAGHDRTKESDADEIRSATLLTFSSSPQMLAEADVFIVTVPTPIDAARRPDLSALHKASLTVGQALKLRALRQPSCRPVVIYESTVFPGATEDVCVPCLEQSSDLTFNHDFFCGYSPERINPGDREHRLTTVIKVTSGSTTAVADWVDAFYGSIIEAGTFKAASIRVAEAAKVIENTQRDLNIALVNELAIIFRKLGIDTLDVLEAAGTKWNFLPFRPGLVGGHCIGVDPYYLTHKAEEMGYHPQVVLAGRRINDGMGGWIVEQLILEMARRRLAIGGSRVLVLGLTFKENCPDLRNTRVVDIIASLRNYGIEPMVVDPWADPEEADHEYGLRLHASLPDVEPFAAVIAAVAHQQFRDFSPETWRALLQPQGVLMDLKGIIPRSLSPIRL